MSDHDFNHYFIADSIETCEQLVDKLTQSGVSEEEIGVISKDPDIVRADVPEIDISEKTKLLDSLQRGALMGSSTGLLAGVLLATFPAAGITLGGAAIASMAAGGAALGAWSASMIGISEQSPLVEKFDEALASKKTLIVCRLNESTQNSIESTIANGNIGQLLEQGKLQ